MHISRKLTALIAIAALLSMFQSAQPLTAAPSYETTYGCWMPLKITAAIKHPHSGENVLNIKVVDAKGRLVSTAKVGASVNMTTMDMGAIHPAVSSIGNGKYRATVNFSMSGPWRVDLKVAVAGMHKPQTASFDFNAR